MNSAFVIGAARRQSLTQLPMTLLTRFANSPKQRSVSRQGGKKWRWKKVSEGGMVFHALNRANARGRQQVNQPQADAEVATLRCSVNRGAPFGESDWTKRIVKRLRLEVTIRSRGRPKLPTGELAPPNY